MWTPRHWYVPRGPRAALLAPLALAFGAGAATRRALYRHGLLRSHHAGVPVLVVGNITVGGTGKTPVVAAIARRARAAGWRPGIILRGHGGRAARWPRLVTPDCDPGEVGDEAVLLAGDTGVPVVAGPDRVAAARLAVHSHRCDLLLSDDGLQHYRLARDAEIAVVDGQRRLGNAWLLPAGPLREPPWRLRGVDLCLVNGAGEELGFELTPVALETLDGQPVTLDWLRGRAVDAVAGIGNPQRFFDTLAALGAEVHPQPFADHRPFEAGDFRHLGARPVVMTAKDAVKCRRLALAPEAHVLHVEALFTPTAAAAVDALLAELSNPPGRRRRRAAP